MHMAGCNICRAVKVNMDAQKRKRRRYMYCIHAGAHKGPQEAMYMCTSYYTYAEDHFQHLHRAIHQRVVGSDNIEHGMDAESKLEVEQVALT